MLQTSLQYLPAHILSKRALLPEKPVPAVLTGKHVRLEPLIIARDAAPLFEFSHGASIVLNGRSVGAYDADEVIWRYMFEGPFANLEAFKASLEPYVNASHGLCLCVFDVASGKQIGVANLMNNNSAHLKIELGGIWYSPIAQRTQANTEAAYLLLQHIFDLGYRRAEWKCDARNERSRRSAQRIGFTFEGIQESHMIVKGCSRDTAWFRILDAEWPEVKDKLQSLLE